LPRDISKSSTANNFGEGFELGPHFYRISEQIVSVVPAEGGVTHTSEEDESRVDFTDLGTTIEIKSPSRSSTPCRFKHSHLASRVSEGEQRVSEG
jgi:hypothetical protein